ncbi:hypothetical protein KC222_14810 [Cedecea davisae]|uniref:Uncharacterized protein n=1 Tax=Cedecea davisae TaxID=158484 RepID=A0ABS6DJD9_9ENTR|nr:hypothetical protein [Cedecea davisae]MBU4683282.1 hypothetical protein [Cedecea davisae]MBU4686746.1 hypothetical protein [Cedecea davisae]
MDTSSLTLIGTLIVALISGLLAITANSSTKEKEIKLSVYEKLGVEVHEALEKLENNFQYLLLTFCTRKTLRRNNLINASERISIDVEKIRELRVRVKFFDEKSYFLYEEAINIHGKLLPEILGYRQNGLPIPINPHKEYTYYEKKKFQYLLEKSISKINENKEKITTTVSSKYRKTISSSRKIIFLLILVIVCSIVAITQTPVKKEESYNKDITLLCL